VNKRAVFDLIDEEYFVDFRAFHRKNICENFDAGSTQLGKPTPIDLGIGVTNAGNDTLDAGSNNGFSAWRSASVVRAWFEIDI